MKLTVLSVTKDWTGLIDLTVRIEDKDDYTFTLSSQHDVDEFERMKKHHPGLALNYVKRVKVKNNFQN